MAHPVDSIAAALRAAQRILVVTHVHPDGDALGSQLGLGTILSGMGKQVVLYSEDQVSHLYDFLPGSAGLTTTLPTLGGFDCGIALDCGDEFRLGKAREQLLALHPFLVIDHHAGHREFGDLRWVDPHRASTGEMIYDLAQALDAEIPALAAYCLYAAIVSDTGSFKYSSTTDETFRVARELILKGVKPAEVAAKLFDNFSVNRLHLMKMVLDSLKLYADNRIAFIDAPSEVFLQTGASRDDAENFINFPRAINTVRVAAFLKEPEKGLVAVSLRSKGTDCDVAKVAAKFGGGGHRNAAGFKLNNTTIATVREQLLAELLPMVAH
ncbi:MAG TPA: bifunctional oligoribonuclease/PAP phosphatase NrnA [Desulfurivibrionaceae bacterium]|nr:bifunctional oligoribonuclease/PAP phosphatase NrnA [Desulfurivibrionaceae bacterium]